MPNFARRAATSLLTAFRRRWGTRDINWTPEFMGFGNHLYLWCWAHEGRTAYPSRRVLLTPKMRYWAEQVPGFAHQFLIDPADVRLLDRRDHYWARKESESGFEQGFSPQGRTEFIGALTAEPLLSGIRDSVLGDPSVLTLNVRRGDYYSVAAHRAWFAIDLQAHLELAVASAIDRDGPVRRIHLVSDDIAWCRTHLASLRRYAAELTVPPESASPADNFRDVCASRRLVISNSTFSLWGAFVSRTVHGQDPGMIWAPAFFQSTYGPGRCVEYDPDFSFVDELPDGWQPAWVLAGEVSRPTG